jgi:hypothetical protein
LALELEKELKDRGKISIIDDYIPRLSKQLDIAFSQYATYIGNIQTCVERYNQEVQQKDSDVIITCGSLIENSVYMAMNAFALAKSYNDNNLAGRMFADNRSNITMQWMGMFRYDAWKYDHAFYLPLQDDVEDSIAKLVAENFKEAAEAFRVEYKELSKKVDVRIGEVLAEILKKESDELVSTDS